MADPFAAALATLHASAGAVAAVYTPAGGAGVALRLIRLQPSEIDARGFGSGRIVHDLDMVEIRVADIARPVRGDGLVIGAFAFVVADEPLRDVEGLTWRFGIQRP